MSVKEKLVEKAISHFWHGVSHDIFSEPVTTYAKLAIEALEKEKESGVTVQECGEWEEIEDDWNMETIYKCSACKEEFVTIDGTPADNLWNYCPNCGAKMMPQPPKGE